MNGVFVHNTDNAHITHGDSGRHRMMGVFPVTCDSVITQALDLILTLHRDQSKYFQ